VGLITIYPTLELLCNSPPSNKAVDRSLTPLLENPQADLNYPALTYRKEGGKLFVISSIVVLNVEMDPKSSMTTK
jgi:hypothetical protein